MHTQRETKNTKNFRQREESDEGKPSKNQPVREPNNNRPKAAVSRKLETHKKLTRIKAELNHRTQLNDNCWTRTARTLQHKQKPM